MINLAPGKYSLTSVDNSPTTRDGNGLPVITGTMTINGENAETTIIERDPAAPRFRIFAVAPAGKLTLNRLTIGGGPAGSGAGISNGGTLTITTSVIDRNGDGLTFPGGGIDNRGTLILLRSIVTNNLATFDGGGIFNSGTATSMSSTIAHNAAEGGGGVQNGGGVPAGTVTIQNSTVSDNSGDTAGGIFNGRMGMMIITNSTIANNFNFFLQPSGRPGGIFNSGVLQINNTTVAGNVSGRFIPVLSGIGNFSETLELQNTIIDQCSGPITSLGNNVIADLTDCPIIIRPLYVTGDPGLAAFIDDGTPGGGRFPLLADSQAIDAGNESVCPRTDQLETPRRGRCDIGAVEFYPVVNDVVALANVKTDFDPTPVPNGPAGTFRIIAEFTNTGTQTIGHRFAEVVELSGGNLLLNADHGAGGIGARLTSPDSASKPVLPGATEVFEFIIGLQTQEPFTFFVNMLGDPQISNTSVTHLGKQ